MEVKEEVEIPYSNDLFFKYCFGTNNKISKELREYLLLKITNKKFEEVIILNPDINPKSYQDKHIILDIHARQLDGSYINIEMQVSKFSISQYLRFQYYAAKIASKQIVKGQQYDRLHKIYEIVLIDDMDLQAPNVINYYVLKNQMNQTMHNALIHIYFVQLPVINEIVKERGIGGLTEFEKMIYLFKNGTKGSILKVIKDEERKVLKMIEKHREFTFDPELWSEAEAIEKGEMMWNGLLYDYKEEGLHQGLKQGKIQERLSLITKLIVNRYRVDDKKWIVSLNEKQLDSITELVFKKDTYEDLKQAVELIK